MKSLILLLAVVGFLFPNQLSAQEADTQYAIVEYMKVEPGYEASTVDLYNTWEDMGKSTAAAWEAVYPMGVTYEMVNQRSNALRTIVKTEVRMLVDYID